ncbi:hypothetical protein TNCV_3544791 [Trichonephila clavipes]|nr:hypothetical protein TNCV_3544791 [Trichonephila clavipes]
MTLLAKKTAAREKATTYKAKTKHQSNTNPVKKTKTSETNYQYRKSIKKAVIDEIILLSKDKPFKKDTKASPQIVQNLEEKKCMEDKQLMKEEQSPIERHSYKGDAATLKEKQLSLKKPVKEKQLSLKKPVKEKATFFKEAS